jgi:hypothetical protein
VERARRSPQGEDGPPLKGGANRPKTHGYRDFGDFVVTARGAAVA